MGWAVYQPTSHDCAAFAQNPTVQYSVYSTQPGVRCYTVLTLLYCMRAQHVVAVDKNTPELTRRARRFLPFFSPEESQETNHHSLNQRSINVVTV